MFVPGKRPEMPDRKRARSPVFKPAATFAYDCGRGAKQASQHLMVAVSVQFKQQEHMAASCTAPAHATESEGWLLARVEAWK